MKIENANKVYLGKRNDIDREVGSRDFEKILEEKKENSKDKEKLDKIGRLRDEKLYNSLMSNYVTSFLNTKYSKDSFVQ